MTSQGVSQDAVSGGPADMLKPSAFSYRFDQAIRGMVYVYICSLPFSGLLFIERNGFILLTVMMVGYIVRGQSATLLFPYTTRFAICGLYPVGRY